MIDPEDYPEAWPNVRVCVTDENQGNPGKLIRLVARAGVMISGHPQPLGARLRADQDRKEQEELWQPKR